MTTFAEDFNAATPSGLAQEELRTVSFADDADELGSGLWLAGWYKATIIEGYATRKGHQFTTGDSLSKNGDSRNLTLCVTVLSKDGKETRNLQTSFNYRPELLLNATGLAGLREARVEFKGVQSWPGTAKAMQSSSITMGRLGRLEKSVGFGPRAVGEKQFDPSNLVGQQVDVYLGTETTEKGEFNRITNFAKLGEKTGSTTAKR